MASKRKKKAFKGSSRVRYSKGGWGNKTKRMVLRRLREEEVVGD